MDHASAPGRRLHVLFLAKLFPWPLISGGRQRAFHIFRGLASAHDVSYIGLHVTPPDEERDTFVAAAGCGRFESVPLPTWPGLAPRLGGRAAVSHAIHSIASRFRSPIPSSVEDLWSNPLVRAIEEFASGTAIDAVYATQTWMAEHARAAGLGRIIVDVDDINSLMARQRARSATWHRRKLVAVFDAEKEIMYERSLPARFARVVVAKEDDRAFFPRKYRHRVSTVPNGVAVPATASTESGTDDTLLFVGTLIYEPNIDAVRWFAMEVLPRIWELRPAVRFVVAGFGSGARVAEVLSDPRCTMLESPAKLEPLYAAAALVVAPIRIGGGTRIKILDALAHGRAVVSTTFAAEGLGLRTGVDIEYADSPSQMAELCLALLVDPNRRRSLGRNGREQVASRFDWAKIETMLPGVVREVAEETTGSVRG